jgi:hypothetical protein
LLSPAFRAPLGRVLDYLVPLFIENYQHTILTKQIIYFLQSNIVTFGINILPLITNFGVHCSSKLAFEALEDTITMLIIAISNFKEEGINLAS